jgi:hypothetical protein
MNRLELINAVKSKVDEISPKDLIEDVGEGDEKPIAIMIDQMLDECAYMILRIAPVHKLSVTKSTLLAVMNPIDNLIGSVVVPADFVRIVDFKMKDWERSVHELQSPESPLAVRQSNKWLRAGTAKPVAILQSGNAGNTIEYFSVKSSHDIERYHYIKRELAQFIPSGVQDALCWLCASKVLGIFGNTNGAKTASENALGLII